MAFRQLPRRGCCRLPMMTQLVLLLPIFIPLCVRGQRSNSISEKDIVLVNGGIEVPFGRSVYLDPELDLNIQVKPGDRCTVRVIQNDPLAQRPGRLTPVNFPCQFAHQEVQYSHFGARNPSQDKVKLMLRYDSRDDTIIIPVVINVQVSFEQQLEVVTKNVPLSVDQIGGVSNPIDNRVLQFAYDKLSQVCKVTILSAASGLPRYGELVNNVSNGAMHDCENLVQSDIRYRHSSQNTSPNKDFIPMVVELTDRSGNLLKQEYFQVMVRIKEGDENTPPTIDFSSLLLMDVNQFVMTAITPSILMAEDAETPADKLIFNITSPLGYGEGIIVSTDDQNLPITSFYQKDVNDLKIAYKPPASDSDDKRFFLVELEIVDSEGLTSDPFNINIIVKPMNTLAPLATKNAGLVLFEGQSRQLHSSKNLEISDEDNIDDVTVSVSGGLRHGRLLSMGRPVDYFTPANLDTGLVAYEHDGSDTYSDNIIFRLDDGQHKVEFLFPVIVYPEDDEPPVLNVNTGRTIIRGEEVEITPFVLSATDIDSDDSAIKFELQKPLSAEGEIIMRQSDIPHDPHNWQYIGDVYERVVTSWTQQDLLEGNIFYRHTGDYSSDPVIDRIRFKVMDDNIPPNESRPQEFIIRIMPMDNTPPELYPGSPREMDVNEFQLTDITKRHLRYTDADTKDRDLRIRITRKPFDIDPNNPTDPGKIVYSEYPDREVTEFTQAQINHHKIAYKPPSTELGTTPRFIQFQFEVTDRAGNTLPNQLFVIILHPVNNKPPIVFNRGMDVFENGFAVVTTDILDVTDEDTDPNLITFTIAKTPKHGTMQLGTLEMTSGDSFTRLDIEGGIVSYMNSGAEMDKDSFRLEVSDGVHKIPVTINVSIRNIDDEAPELQIAPGTIGARVEVDEGGRSPITTNVIKASDPDTDDQMITFLIEDLPEFGSIEVNGVIADRFKQGDVLNNQVFYVHSGVEIGENETDDSFNLTISDMSNDWIVGGNKIDHIYVSVVIRPVDNVAPEVEIGSLFIVPEGNKSTITLFHLNATDADTKDFDITCTIVVQPTHGYLENVSPAPGSEKSRAGMPISAFTLFDIARDQINYVQSIHKGMEPVEDRFSFSCSDGINHSPIYLFPIQIHPTNDETPEIYMREFIVMEGMSLIIDLPILNAIDLDIPKEKLTFFVKTKPVHGKITSRMPTGPILSFTLDQISRGSNIEYHHDDSETTEDSFELEVSDGVHNASKKFIVVVLPVDDETPRLTINDGLEIEIGDTKIITNQVLKAEDLDSDDGNITFIIRQSPRHGYLSYLDFSGIPLYNLTHGMNFTQTDIDSEVIQYTHTGLGGVRDLIKFDVTDGINPFVDRYFWITVEGIDMVYPDVINKGVELPEGGRITLNTDILSTSDLNSDDQFLIFTITRAPSRGHLESTDNPGVPITLFSQLELAGNKIYYVHSSDDEMKMDSFEFEVTDGYNSVFRTFRISISDVDNKKPVVFAALLRVKEGGDRLITPFELKAEDRDTSEDLIKFTVTQLPVHGRLMRSKSTPVTTFTMADLTANKITYRHDGSETTEDSFSFVVTDGTHVDFFVYPNTIKETRRPVTMAIEVVPVDNVVPQVVVNRGASFIGPLDSGGLGFQFTNKVMRAEDRDSPVEKLLYIITTPPQHGMIINVDLGNNSISNFTQADLNRMSIQYVLNPFENATNDIFHFKVVDQGKNELPDQSFRLNWAWISIEHQRYEVNETERYLKVNLVRRGYLGETSFVGLTLKNQTAKQGLDFGGVYAQQVQFNPGQTEAKWKLRIFDDKLYEKDEVFEFGLEEPVLAALEYPETAEVTIIDVEDESTVFFQEKSFEVSEDVGELLLPVKRGGDLSQEMMVICSTSSDTAVGTTPSTVLSYSDYISRPEDHTSIVHFLKGEDLKVCRLVVIDDSLYEDEENFKVRLTTPMGGRLGRFNETEVKILPDPKDVPSFYFGEPEYYVDESEGYVELMVWRTGTDLSKPATVTVQSRPTEPVSAEVGLDYIGIGRNLDFAPGVTMQTFRVTILDDLGQPVLEGTETFELVLRMPMNAALGEPNRAVVYINDSTSDLPKFQFKEPTYLVFENDSKVNAIVFRSGDLKHFATVRCYTRQDTAKVMDDFDERPDTDDSLIVFAAGEMEKVCTVDLMDDTIYEEDEDFRLVLGTPGSETANGALLGHRNVTIVTIKDDNDKSVIRFEQTRFTVKEPRKSSEDTAVVRIPVVRTGDLSKVSLVRVHTKDGSAKSGVDYIPFSTELEFGPNVSRIVVEIEVMYDGEKEHREAFTVHMRPDRSMVAEVKDTKAVIYIQEMDIVADVTFPSRPMVVSLRDYDDAGNANKSPTPGYPVACITPCDPKHPDFAKTGTLCIKEGINDSLTEFRWRVSAPSDQDGVTSDLKDVESTTFFTGTHDITLDSIYFSAGSRVQCAARAVSVDGDSGLELTSPPVTISQTDGLCTPKLEGSIGAEPFTAKMRYTGPSDPDYPNLIKLTLTIPHWDGMLPVISTRKLTNFELTLSPDGYRVGTHKCSNLLDYYEIQTKHGFLSNVTKNPDIVGEVEPYQYSTEMRSEPTLRFYRNLDLEACMWEFTSFYDMSELVTECGGTIATDGQVLNLIQSYVSVRVPLYVSYVFHSPVATGGWLHNDLSSQLRLTFVYDTAILWQHGIGAPEESQLQGYLYPTRMTIGQDGRLLVNFRTETRFRGQFVLSHPGTGLTSMVMAPDQPDLTFTLELVRSEPTYAQPEQEWHIVSDYAVRDYSGIYHIKLIPCTVTEDVEYSEPLQCNPRDPITFDLHIRFQQVSDPVPTEYSLDTQLHLMRKRALWLSNGSMGFGEDSDASFIPGDTVYGRIMMDPTQNLGESFFVNVEKCFLCTGVDGYIPKYDPESNEYGCVTDSNNLLHAFKIIDKGAPRSVTRSFRNIPFNAVLASDDNGEGIEYLRRQPAADGFHFDSAPLFQVSYGRQWFVHCIYTIRSKENAARGIGKRSIPQDHPLHHVLWRTKRALEDVDDIGRQTGRGTNMNRLVLDFSGKPRLNDDDNLSVRSDGKFEIGSKRPPSSSDFPVFPVVMGVIGSLLVIAVTAALLARRQQKVVTSSQPVTVVNGKGHSRVVDRKHYFNSDDNTEV